MTDKSKKYSFALGMWFIVLFASTVYTYVMNVVFVLKRYEVSIGKYYSEIFDYKPARNAEILDLAIIAVLLFLMLAFLLNNRVLFFLGVLLNVGAFAFKTYLWASKKGVWKKENWEDQTVFAFIYGCVIIALLLLFMLIMAIQLLCAAEAVSVMSIVVLAFAILNLLLITATDILGIFLEDWDVSKWNARLSSFGVGRFNDPTKYLLMFMPVLLIRCWADSKVEEVRKVKFANRPAPMPVQPAVAPAFVPVQPVTNAPVMQQPVPAPVAQPVIQPVAAEPFVQPVAEAPVEPVIEPVAEAAAQTVEAAAEPVAEAVAETAEAVDDSLSDIISKYADEPAAEAAAVAEETAEAVQDTFADAGEIAEQAVTETAEAVTETAEAATEVAAEAADAVDKF
ncbi:MAG: hypothetical protein J5872_05420 [Lachnospiraceae bacterium]|nr:hypothetical protein [Lachnospiraceae bacterium]